ncbi:hypothetical protein OAE00_01200 [bacterium]|jgi:hypothetical protein|nr:hypothetical protein [bacterium]MDC1204795.1 hypothetical protein [Salibacteraceae bacterium]
MMDLLKKPLVQFVLLGIVLFGIQQVSKDSTINEPIQIDNQVREHLKRELETEWQVKPDSLILNVAKEKWIEQELLYRIAVENELDQQSDLVKKAMIETAEEFILSQVDFREPSNDVLEEFMKTSDKVYLTKQSISFRQYFFGQDLMFAQKSLFDSKEIEIEGSEPIEIPANQTNKSYRQVASDFGVLFSDSLQGKPANWRGIVPSKFGIHVVVVDSAVDAKIANLSDVRSKVLTDFRRQQLVSFRDSMLTELRGRTEIVETVD